MDAYGLRPLERVRIQDWKWIFETQFPSEEMKRVHGPAAIRIYIGRYVYAEY